MFIQFIILQIYLFNLFVKLFFLFFKTNYSLFLSKKEPKL